MLSGVLREYCSALVTEQAGGFWVCVHTCEQEYLCVHMSV